MPRNERVHFVFLLDRSGSMLHLRDAAVDGLNDFLARQEAVAPDATATVVLFAEMAQTMCQNLPIHQARLSPVDYDPCGQTALLDAVGSSIDRVGWQIARLPPEERPHRVLFSILTDGEENASRGYTMLDVQWRIRRQAEIYGWEFLFLGASETWRDQARELGIPGQAALRFSATPEGIHEAFASAADVLCERRGWTG